jgi:hypothetical protein
MTGSMTLDSSRDHTHRRIGLILVAVVAMICRVGAGGLASGRLRDDPDGYRRLADRLWQHGVFGESTAEFDSRDGMHAHVAPTAYRPPLYPLLLAFVSVGGGLSTARIVLLHAMLGAATATLTFAIAWRMQMGRWSYLAAALVTCDPILLNQAMLVMTETLAALLAVAAWLALLRTGEGRMSWQTPLSAGWMLGLATLCRPTFLVWWMAVMLAAAIAIRPIRHGVIAGLLIFAGGILTLAPWAGRNLAVFGRPILSTTHGGYTLWLGNNPEFYEFMRSAPPGSVFDSAPLDARYVAIRLQFGRDEVAADRWAYDQAWTAIRAEPQMFVRASLSRIGMLWRATPHRTDAAESPRWRWTRVLIGGWYVLLFAFAGWGFWALRRKLFRSPWLWGLLLCGSFTAVHAVYWSNMRMRAPLMPVVCLLAAVGVSIIARLKGYSEPFFVTLPDNPPEKGS